MIPDKIQSGFGAIDSNNELSPFVTRIMSLVLLLIKKAMITAGKVVQHRGESIVGPAEVNKALMHEAMVFFESETLEQDLDEIVEMFEEFMDEEAGLGDDLSNCDSISSFSDSLLDSIVDDATLPETELGDPERVCECDMCTKIRDVDTAWASWDTEGDPVKEFLKSHIDVLLSEGVTELDM